MTKPTNSKRRLTGFEMRVMNNFWEAGRKLSVRENQEMFPAKNRPAYTTVQTIVGRLEAKGAAKRLKKIGNAYLYEPIMTREEALSRLVDDALAHVGGSVRDLLRELTLAGLLGADDVDYLKSLTAKKS